MKINFPALFQTPLQKYRFFLVYGNDEDVFERALSFLQKKLGGNLTSQTEQELASGSCAQPSLFQEMVPSLAFMPHVTDKIVPLLESLKAGPYILTSEKTRAQSKLVTFFAQSPIALAIGAYSSPVTTSEFEYLIHEAGLSSSFKTALFKTYQNDYRGLVGALDKIKLYGELQEEDYPFFLDSSSVSDEANLLTQAFLLKNVKGALVAFTALDASELIPLLRSLGRSFQILLSLFSVTGGQRTIPWTTITPPIFFKDQPLYEKALSKWKSSEVSAFLETLLDLEQHVKFSRTNFTILQRRLLKFCAKS